ncbi:hypothetical protein niasHT_025809 [Heterodera trifolii]|uniref:Uncharacterized protein n=1 Tax=Heterodera trifolii TaxID=157864 RepID=A0ABD2KT12_9BILA
MRAIYFFIALSLPVQCPQTTKNREMLYSDGFEYKKRPVKGRRNPILARVAKEGMKGMARQHLEAHQRNLIAQERVTLSDEARQAINRRLKTGKLSHYYATNNEYKILVRSLAALSFLEEIRVLPAFNLIRQRANELGIQAVPNAGQPVAIFDYFGRNYVNGHDGRPPLFPVHTWNHHDSVLQDLGRTNNAQEGFHLALRMQFNSVHPPLSK